MLFIHREVTLSEDDGTEVLVFKPSGILDIVSATQIREGLIDALAAGKHHIVMNFEGIGFVDPSGLTTLESTLARIEEVGGSFRLANLTPHAQISAQEYGVDQIFEIFETAREAIDASR
jgi:anti-sigma B factor antagonist